MEVKLNETTRLFEIVDLTLDQLNTIINSIAYVSDKGAKTKAEPQKGTPAMKGCPERWVDAILRDFDFARVHKHMKKTNWRWSTDTGPRVPTIEELRKSAWARLTYVAKNGGESSSGGFTATCYDGMLRLSFEIAECCIESHDTEGGGMI